MTLLLCANLMEEKTKKIGKPLLLKIKEAATDRAASCKSPESAGDVAKRSSLYSRPAGSIVAIGASTGGPRALEKVLKGLTPCLPAAVLITQHMPAGFTGMLSKRLDRISPVRVKEATNGERIMESEIYLAPGDFHLLVSKNGTISLSSAAPVNYVRPSVDVMMSSVAEVFGPAAIGVILTGMGRDGAEGMSRIKEKGGRTIVQDPDTAVIPGMPQAVIKKGSADLVVPLGQVAAAILRELGKFKTRPPPVWE